MVVLRQIMMRQREAHKYRKTLNFGYLNLESLTPKEVQILLRSTLGKWSKEWGLLS